MRNLYRNKKWYEFCERVKQRDNYKCLKCGRDALQVSLQVHHTLYINNRFPWEYLISDCHTLCKGCHAREHGLIEPDKGWVLIDIYDAGGLHGTCERRNCGRKIRYEHETYHPSWGYKTVGSTCIQHLTKEDIQLSNDVLETYKAISDFVRDESRWSQKLTKEGKEFLQAKYAYNLVNIYGKKNFYSFNVGIKRKGERWYDFNEKLISAKGKSLEEAKEMAYIFCKGITTESEDDKMILRGLYRQCQ